MRETNTQVAIALLEKLTLAVKEGPHTPELLTRYWQAKYEVYGKRAEQPFIVPQCDWNEKHLKTFEQGGGKLVYISNELTDPEGLHLLERIFPEFGSFTKREGAPITQERSGGGWIGVETSIDAPLRNGSDGVAREVLGFLGLQGQRLSTYIIASIDSWDLTGDFFDKERTESRLLDSRCGDRYVYASFPNNERLLHLNFASPGDHYPYVGTRSEAAKPE
ncbi:MAG TPA: hypothetical protein VMR81_02615 [Patescibacteria group bacterium]|nr:hypothetical protein [Patescibacteria group bacterium]